MRECRRPEANVPDSEFSTDVRVVLCDRCLSPLQTASSGGEATCGHCGAVQVVPPRDDRTPLAPADRAAIPEAERVRLLWAQEDEPWTTPESLRALVPGATIPEARVSEAMTVWNRARRELRETGSREAGERLAFLTLMLGTRHGRAGEPRLKRAVFESALDVLRLPQDLQAIRGGLSRAAALDGDTCSAEAWLAPCDPRPRDLESDSQWRVARAFIDTVHGDWNAVLAVLGRDADEVPVREKLHTLGAMLRANAWERLGRLDTAVELLRRETGYRPDARQAMFTARSYYASLRLCAGSLAELGLAPAAVVSPDAGDAVEADVVSEVADGPSAGEGGGEVAVDARASRPVPSGDRTTGREDAAAVEPSSSGVRNAAPMGDPAVAVDDGSARSGSGVRVESVEGPEDRAPYEDLIPMLQLPLLTLRTRVQAAANRCPSDGTWHGVMTMIVSGGSGTPIRGWDELQYRPSARAGTPEADQLQALATCIVRHLEGVALPFWRYGYQVRVRLSVF